LEAIPLGFENWDQPTHRFNRRFYIWPGDQLTAIVQANNRAIVDLRRHTPDNGPGGEPPVAADYGPHHAQQVQAPLSFPHAGPPHAEWSAEQGGRNPGNALDGILRP
jgi:hypothetical protein